MRVIIAGSRGFDNYGSLFKNCESLLAGVAVSEIVSGGARGADNLGERYAKDKGYAMKVFPADWDAHGKSAGYKRNEQMAKYGDMLIAFWDGKSNGTRHVIDLARRHGIAVHVVMI